MMKNRTRRMSSAAAIGALAAGLLVLWACPNPIDKLTFYRLTDKTPPVVTISAPANNSAYTQTVTIQGKQDKPGRLKSLDYSVAGTLGVLTTGTVPLASIGADGSFSFQFSTLTFTGPIAATVTAKDWNDNVGQGMVTLTSPGSSISSFTATPGNKKVTLNWEPIANATYTVYYTTNGTLPTETYGNVVTPSAPPYDITGLKNGGLHVFLLKAHTSGGTDYWSGFVSTIPLSLFTLAPQVSAGYRQISLDWSAIDGTDQFAVFRDTDPAGAFPQYTGVITSTSFTDTNVLDNTWYYYKVKPVLAGTALSTFNAAQTVQIPPGSSQAITSINTPTPANKVKLFGNYAFVAAGTSGLLVIDVSLPSAPRIVASLATTDAQDIDLDAGGTYAFIADGAGGVKAIDISNPLAPVLRGSYSKGGTSIISAITVIPGYAYLLDSDTVAPAARYSVYGVNISNPAAMTDAGTYVGSSTYRFTDLAATITSGSRYVYIAAGGGGATAWGLLRVQHNNTSPFFTYLSVYTNANYNPYEVDVARSTTAGSYVYSLGTAKTVIEPPPAYVLMVINMNMTTEHETGSSKGYLADVFYYAAGNKVYAADGIGLQVIDVSNPSAPVLTNFWNTPGPSMGAVSNGSYGFVVSGPLGFQTVDLSVPSPVLTGGIYSAANLAISVVRGTTAYAAISVTSPRLQALNVSNPLVNPVAQGSVTLAGPTGVSLSGSYAFVADGSSGLKVVDVSNPSAPTLAGSAAAISGYLKRIAVKGDFAYVAASTGLQVYDISDPAHPFGVGFADTDGGGMQDVALRGHYAYVTDGAYFQPTSLKILDVSNPLVPALVGKPLTGAVIIGNVSLYGDYAFVTDSLPNQGLWAVNINPNSAAFMVSYGPCDTTVGGTAGTSVGVAAFGTYAYVADSTGGFAVVDTSSPTTLSDTSLVSNLALSSAQDLTISGKYAYVADSTGLRIVRLF